MSNARDPTEAKSRATEDGFDGEWVEDLVVEVPITDVLDLHPFRPNEVPGVVREYLDAAHERGLRELRIIHGRGIGQQRKTVHTLLDRDLRVVRYGDAPPEAGGWGATLVWLQD